MSKEKIRMHNEEQFLDDLKVVRGFMVFCTKTNAFFKIRKMDVLANAERREIRYYITDKIFVVRRKIMVII